MKKKFCGWLTAIATNKSKNKLKGKVEYQIDDEVLIAKTETDELMLPEEYINKAEKKKGAFTDYRRHTFIQSVSGCFDVLFQRAVNCRNCSGT